MRFVSALPTAIFAASSLVAAAPALAKSPVLIEIPDEEVGDAIAELLPDRPAPTSLFEAERLAEEAAARASVWLRSEGYYAAAVTPEAQEDPPAATLTIAPGARFRFTAPTLSYDGPAPDENAQAAALLALNGLHEGAPARAAGVLAAEAHALSALQHAGYADSVAGERRVVVDHAAESVAAELRFSVGAHARLGALRHEPAGLFRQGFIDSVRNWSPGDPYQPDALARLRRDLAATGAVSRVATQLAPANESGIRDVVLEVEAAPRNAYELGFGYSSTDGFGVEAEWTRRNLTGRADALSVSTTLGEIRQDLTLALTRPHAAGLGHTANFGTSLQREENEAFTREGASLFASVDASTRLRISRSYGASLSADRFDNVASGVTDALVLSGFADLRNDTTGFSLDPRDGSIFELRLEPTVSTGDATLAFLRTTAEARVFESFAENDALTLAARVGAGWLEPLAGSANDAPPDRRFYAGGGGSVRGYPYHSIYPRERDPLGLAPGGDGMLEASLEARWRFHERWGAAFFVDGGTAFDDWSDAGALSWGAGLGVRYDLGFAPLRVDFAFPLDRDQAQSDVALYISIGQAF